MSNYVLDRAYRVDEPNGVARHRVVVLSEQEDGCAYPSQENAGGILGVTTHAQTREGRAVAVRRLGIAPVEAASALSAGDHVAIADNQGRIKRATPPAAVVGTAGSEGAVRYRALHPAGRFPIASVVHIEAGDETELSAEAAGGVITVNLATDGSGVAITTAAQLVEFLNADPELSRLVRAEIAGGTGSGTAAAGEAGFVNLADSVNIVGIAQQSATAEGDIVDVLLTP